MKKYIGLLTLALLALSLTACGDNKTKQKLVGVSVIDSNSGGSTSSAANPTVALSQTYANTQTAITDASAQVGTVMSSVLSNGAPAAPSAPTGLASPARNSIMNARFTQKQRILLHNTFILSRQCQEQRTKSRVKNTKNTWQWPRIMALRKSLSTKSQARWIMKRIFLVQHQEERLRRIF